MKKIKIIFWIATGIIFLFEGVLPALTSHSEMAIQGITHLGYPLYFVTYLTVWKVLGGLALIIPQVPARIKEWAYAGYAFDFISAFVSTAIVDGFHPSILLAVFAMALLVISYVTYHKIKAAPVQSVNI